MVRARSSDVSAPCRNLVDTPENKLIRIWVWEYVLKYPSDVRMVRELTASLPFPDDVRRLKQMSVIREFSSQVSKDLDIQKTLNFLEALQRASEDPHLEDSEDVVLSKLFKRSSSAANDDGTVWKGLRQPTFELQEELHKLLREGADGPIGTGMESRLSAFVRDAWALFGPVFLERTEAAVISGKYDPQGVLTLRPVAEHVGAGENSGAKPSNEESVVELQTAVDRSNDALERRRQELADGCVDLWKVVEDPLPALVRKPDGGAPRIVKRSLLDPHPSAQAQVWDEEDEIEESPSPLTPSASRQIRLPPLRSPNPRPVASPVAIQAVGTKLRRPKKKWTEEEVELLKREVEKYGRGRWKLILQKNIEVLRDRTEVDIKDKWRNLEKYNFK